MRLIILGAPGAGKGTQAEVISDRYSIPILGTGNIIREAMKAGTSTGQQVAEYMDKGDLVPDEIVIQLLKDRMSEADAANGYVLDGFPRNLAQAEELEKMGVAVDRVISIEIDDAEVLARLSGREICGKCGSSYHIVYKKPLVENVCDRCGGTLVVRHDDEPEIIKERLRVYHEITAPVKEYYRNTGKLYEVKSQNEIAETTKLTLAALEA